MDIFSKRGQASLEYMSTYMWTFVGIVLAVGALTYTGVFDGDRYATEECDSGTQIACEDAYFTTSGSLRILIRNNLEEDITIVSAQVTDPEKEVQPQDIDISPGDSATIVLETGNAYEENSKEHTSYLITYRKYSAGAGTPPNHNIRGEATVEVIDETDSLTDEPVGYCGNGIVDDNLEEECDYGHIDCSNSNQYCNSECKCVDKGPKCGIDGVNIGEECDVGFEDNCQPGEECINCKCVDPDDDEETCSDEGTWMGDMGSNSCCGDDEGEFVTHQVCDSDASCSTITGTAVCCDDENDCVLSDTCFDDGDVYEFELRCEDGTWKPSDDNRGCDENNPDLGIYCDEDEASCSDCEENCQDLKVEELVWFDGQSSFEAGHPGCCGDDSYEFPISCQFSGTGPNPCPNDDYACCNNEDDCVYNGDCYADSERFAVGDTASYVCLGGDWQLDEDQ